MPSFRLLLFTITIAAALEQTAAAHPIDLNRIQAIESSGRPWVTGSAGERGLFQIRPIVHAHFKEKHPGVSGDLFDPQYNRRVANWYFEWLFRQCRTPQDTIIAYNRGIGNWRKWTRQGSKERDLPITTKQYLKKYFKTEVIK